MAQYRINLSPHNLALGFFFIYLRFAGAADIAPPHVSVPRSAEAPVIDGSVGAGEWHGSAWIEMRSPVRDFQSSAVRAFWMPEGIYIAYTSVDKALTRGETLNGQSLHKEDVLELFIDPTGDLRQYFEIQINPQGKVYCHIHILTDEPSVTGKGRLTPEFMSRHYWAYPSPHADGIQVACRYDSAAGLWSAEGFFPVSFINRRQGAKPLNSGMVLRANFARYDWNAPLHDLARRSVFVYWSPVAPGCPHISPTRMGYLELVPGKPPSPTTTDRSLKE